MIATGPSGHVAPAALLIFPFEEKGRLTVQEKVRRRRKEDNVPQGNDGGADGHRTFRSGVIEIDERGRYHEEIQQYTDDSPPVFERIDDHAAEYPQRRENKGNPAVKEGLGKDKKAPGAEKGDDGVFHVTGQLFERDAIH